MQVYGNIYRWNFLFRGDWFFGSCNLYSPWDIPALQQRGSVDSTILIQDGAPSHIATPVKHLWYLHFGNDRIISRHFQAAWPPRSLDLIPCDFWLWGYLKDVVYVIFSLLNTIPFHN
ncbi:hypothetical protein AVEN_178973-1 [Araneus ventricosus]|uniref:Tc1-like transposase DDE domain-containing protein n=1 Tax=Araneus ventricosus TaxID=182803 RepID=A0A4Y2N3X5_ARAVE|nr:hypothetical protein AVEN_178973-1 [Araneus ventricosus]